MARAFAATVSWTDAQGAPAAAVPVRTDAMGRPVLLPSEGSALGRHLAISPASVTVAVPAIAPFRSLRITGVTLPVPESGYPVYIQSLEFTGATPTWVTLDQYQAAAPDPFWREAPSVLHHLEQFHMTELVSCVRANGLTTAEYAIPRGLDRFGLELLVFSPTGLVAVRLSYPGGPVASLRDVPASIRTVLTCHCVR